MEMRASGLMERRWVCEQLRLVQCMDDKTSLKFKSEVRNESKMVMLHTEEEPKVCMKNSRPPARKLAITNLNKHGLDYL